MVAAKTTSAMKSVVAAAGKLVFFTGCNGASDATVG